MFGQNKKIRIIMILISIVVAIALAGCNLIRPPAPKENESNKKKNPPKALTQMEKETDGMIQGIEEVQQKRARQLREEEHPSKESQPKPTQQGQQQNQGQQGSQGQQMGQQQEQSQNNQGQQGEQQQSSQQGQQQGEQKKPSPQPSEPTPKPIPEPDWNMLETTVETLHEHWNSYEPSAKADGAMQDTMKGFKEQLISLTEQIMARNEEKTLTAANTLYSYYSDFLKLYAHNQPPEVTELRGLTRQIIQYGQQEKWAETTPLLGQMKKSWQEAKTKMKKPDKMLNSRIDAALSDFQFVIKEKKINLARIKGNILIKNLDQVE